MNYYNENDPFAANWLRELIKAKLIPNGVVDDRSIIDVEPQDLKKYNQYHFFAGIGGWPYALKLSGWNADRPVWTGSCPCQSLSCAGKGLGEKDERHLWPVFFNLIKELRPPEIFGEQVASKDGREWLAGVRNDLEAVGYAVGAADLPACSVSAPHKRNRLFWVAESKSVRLQKPRQVKGYSSETSGGNGGGLGNTRCVGLSGNNGGKSGQVVKNGCAWHNSIPIKCADGKWRRVPGRVADNDSIVWGTWWENKSGEQSRHGKSIQENIQPENKYEIEPTFFPLLLNGLSDSLGADRYQSVIEALNCFPLAGNIPGRVGLLKGAGNAIVPAVASEFIQSYMEI